MATLIIFMLLISIATAAIFFYTFALESEKNYKSSNQKTQNNINNPPPQQHKSDSSLAVKWDANNTTYSSSPQTQNSSSSSSSSVSESSKSDPLDKYLDLIKESIKLVRSNSLSFQKTKDYEELVFLINSGRGEQVMNSDYNKFLNSESSLDKWHFRVDMWNKFNQYILDNIDNNVSPSVENEYNTNIVLLTIGLKGFYKFHNPHNFNEYEKKQMDEAFDFFQRGFNGLVAHRHIQNMMN